MNRENKDVTEIAEWVKSAYVQGLSEYEGASEKKIIEIGKVFGVGSFD